MVDYLKWKTGQKKRSNKPKESEDWQSNILDKLMDQKTDRLTVWQTEW